MHSSPTSAHTCPAGPSHHDSESETMSHIVKSTQPGTINGVLVREYAIVEFSYFMSPGMRSHNQAWTTQKAVPFDFPIGNLTSLCDAACKMTRSPNHRFMLYLKGKGGGMHMSAAIKFHDERDLYANLTAGIKPRITTIRYLFSGLNLEDAKQSREPLFIPIAVDVFLPSESESDAHPLPKFTPSPHFTTPLPPRAPSPSSNLHSFSPSPIPLNGPLSISLCIHLINHLHTLSLDHIPLPARISTTPSGSSNGTSMIRGHEFFATRRSAGDVGK
ncbi:hypothetical protein DOTSEDRAFT_77444 [Dothistroma septosporum NZE10]|uniref:Uncharacterized protein n=1 Tax=Dothistroma septosporum (strain NZE10 / CBS 128990) TaxID=675120 RepID=N1PUD0_DOTSN|nr:hypothetical protein DOTSEDRAFT_77444 [Dothistroma septosporum NZE10]